MQSTLNWSYSVTILTTIVHLQIISRHMEDYHHELFTYSDSWEKKEFIVKKEKYGGKKPSAPKLRLGLEGWLGS